MNNKCGIFRVFFEYLEDFKFEDSQETFVKEFNSSTPRDSTLSFFRRFLVLFLYKFLRKFLKNPGEI